jgi:hypothetical protein
MKILSLNKKDMEVVEHNIDRKSCPVLFYANNFE